MQEEMTITEALAEIKLSGKKVAHKREMIKAYITRPNSMVDPLADSGGSRKVLEQERQSVADILTRIVRIRRAIQTANALTVLRIGEMSMPVADWLVWRREVAPVSLAFLQEMKQEVDRRRQEAVQRGWAVVGEAKQPEKATDLLVNVSEKKILDSIASVTEVLGQLDGKLSLVNATTKVTF